MNPASFRATMKRMGTGADRNRAGKRIAFYGGSFDPPHRAHLAVAQAARQALDLDEVLFAPVGTQPLKADGASASFKDRVAMTRLAINGRDGFRLSLADAPRSDGRANYSFDTLTRLKADLGEGCQLFCLVGADSLAKLRLWYRAVEIPFLAPLIVAARPGEALLEMSHWLPEGVSTAGNGEEQTRAGIAVREFELHNAAGCSAPLFLLPGLDYDTSASGVREWLRAGSPEAAAELPAAVLDYLRAHRLYQ
jgi:nicotinate-nucleotide adenylyltransferase